MIYEVLSEKYRTHKSLLNHNNEIGLCQTLMNMPEDTEFLVVEMGMRKLGEIELLAKYAEPDFAVITNVGTAHLGRLGSIENIAKAKCEIVKYLNPDGVFIAHDDKLIKDTCKWNGKKVFYGKNYEIREITENSIKFVYEGNEYTLPANGEFNVINALAAIEIGKLVGVSTDEIRSGLSKFILVGERGRIINLKNNIKIIADYYNANPDSMKASIDSVISTYTNTEIILVLGDMAELGNDEIKLHKEIGEFLSGKNISLLVTVGEKAALIAKSLENKNIKAEICKNNEEAADYLNKNLHGNSVLLLKASRCMKFEEILERLTNCLSSV